MIKIDTIEDKKGFRLECRVEGVKSTVAQELAAILNELAKGDEELVAVALDMYLDMRGFKE